MSYVLSCLTCFVSDLPCALRALVTYVLSCLVPCVLQEKNSGFRKCELREKSLPGRPPVYFF